MTERKTEKKRRDKTCKNTLPVIYFLLPLHQMPSVRSLMSHDEGRHDCHKVETVYKLGNVPSDTLMRAPPFAESETVSRNLARQDKRMSMICVFCLKPSICGSAEAFYE